MTTPRRQSLRKERRAQRRQLQEQVRDIRTEHLEGMRRHSRDIVDAAWWSFLTSPYRPGAEA